MNQGNSKTQIAVRAENLSKSFRIHAGAATSLKEILVRGIVMHETVVDYEALKSVSFELPKGQSLAIIGSNGSGKSTLLKLITGITEPTSGTVQANGRIAALLELGAGFHDDLTGMENIFAQGSIMGMSRAQILERLDDILEFSELGKFIHTPLKRYSSGMIVRLGFSLAVFSGANILLIDEVLAVGDSSFRQKCLRKIRALREEGKTILFVSHDLPQVEAVADRLLWLERGEVLMHGTLAEVIPDFIAATTGNKNGETQKEEESELQIGNRGHRFLMTSNPEGFRVAPKGAVIEHVEFLDEENNPRRVFEAGDSMVVEINYRVFEDLQEFDIQLGYGGFENRMAWHGARIQGLDLNHIQGQHIVRVTLPSLPFKPGRYKIGVALVKSLRDFDFYDIHVEAYFIHVRGQVAGDEVGMTIPPGKFVD